MYPGVRSQDSIIEWILYPDEPDGQGEMAGHYVFVSRGGTLSVWSKDMTRRFETSIETSDDGGTGKATTWATSLACLPKEKLLAVATTSGDIRFFRCSLYKFEHKFSVVCIPHIVLRLSCHDSQRLVCGDFSGGVYILQADGDFFDRNRRRASHLPPEKLIFDHVKIGKVAGLAYVGTTKQHLSPVQRVEYIPTLMAVISCSVNTKRAMMIHFLENNESLCFTSSDGINSFVFSKRLNAIVTGGTDHVIKIWNPTVTISPNESLTGHSSPVNHVLVMEDRLLLISCDRERTVRVWDLLRPKCLQIIKFRESVFPGRQTFASVFLDPLTGSLILTTYWIGKLELLRTSFRDKTHPGSEYVVLADYSAVYDCLVTVGSASSIAVWDGPSGRLVYEYDRSHESCSSGGVPYDMGILSACLDPSQRRLVTADRIGKIKVWNFHLGLCLKSFDIHCTVLSVCLVGFDIYAAGSSGLVLHLYDNGDETIEPEAFEKQHVKSIVSLDRYRQHLLASASVDGQIVVWLRKSTDPKIFLKDLEEDQAKDADVDEDYLAKTEVTRRRQCSISQILFLQRREMESSVGNLVSCGTDGRIRFWNIVSTNRENNGRLLTRFRAVFRSCDGVLCLATDEENHYVISGDTMGYVRVYELDGYCDKFGCTPPRSGKAPPKLVAKFPFLKMQQLMQQKHSEHCKFSRDGGSEIGFVPYLLNCFRAHLGAVLRVSYVSAKDMLITAGRESSVRLWTLSGVYAGRLGPTAEPWGFRSKLGKTNSMPPDIRAVASSLSLFVMNNGTMPFWTRGIEALKKCRVGNQPEGFEEKPFSWKLQKSLSAEELTAGGDTLEDELSLRLPYFRGARPCTQNIFEDIKEDI